MTTGENLDTINGDAFGKILKKLDFKDITRLRRVCHNLKNSIDDVKPDIRLTTIDISIRKNLIQMRCSDFANSNEVVQSGIRFSQNATNTADLTYFEDFLRTFKRVILHQKTKMKSLDIVEYDIPGYDQFISKLGSILSSRPHVLKVDKLRLFLHKEEELATILRNVDTESLEDLNINLSLDPTRNKEDDWTMVGQLDQWKRAKTLLLAINGTEVDLRNFLHFEHTRIQMGNVSVEELIAAKDRFFTTPEKLYFSLEANVDDLRGFIQSFPQSQRNNLRRDKEWFIRIEGQDAIITVSTNREGNFIVFDRNPSTHYREGRDVINYITL